MKINLKNYFLLILFSLFFILIILGYSILYLASKEQLTKEKVHEFKVTQEIINNYLEFFAEKIHKDIDFIVKNLNLKNLSQNKYSLRERYLSINPAIRHILILDRNNRVKDVIPFREDLIGIDLSKAPFIYGAEKIKFFGPHISIVDKKPYYVVLKKVSNLQVVTFIEISALNLLIERLKEQNFYAFILDSKGLVLAHVKEDFVKEGLNLSHQKFVQEGIKEQKEFIMEKINGEEFIFLATKLPNSDYISFIGQKKDIALGALYNLKKRFFLLSLAFLVFLLFFSLAFSGSIINPINKIILMIAKFKRREPLLAGPISHINEFNSIAEAILEMSKTVADRESKLIKIFEASKDAIIISNFEGVILDFNESAAKMFGFRNKKEVNSEMQRDKIYFYEDADREFIYRELMEKGFVENLEIKFKRIDGTTFYGLISSSFVKDEFSNPLFIVSIVKDITEKRKLQEQLFQAQKMESIGRLAGSIAHDFNNILSVIYSSNQLIQMYTKRDEKVEKYTSSITKAVEKARDFVKKLLLFSKRQLYEPNIYEINETLMEEIKLLKTTLREDITLELNLADKPLYVYLDRTQFSQLLLNLTVNAIEAMPKGGRIKISTEEKFFEYQNIQKYPFVKEGNFVCINFSDTGTGIPSEIIDKIFDPFFSTKPDGTGLGLATVYSIVQQHKGFINVYSEVGRGATFKIYLPLVEKSSDAKGTYTSERSSKTINLKRILLVEDNDEVRNLIEEIMKLNGFEVYSFSKGPDALAFYRGNKDKIDFCLFDIIMPSMGGFQLYQEIKKIKNDVKVIFMTGYADNLEQVQTILKEGQIIINKPFGIEEFKRKLELLLND